MYQRDKLRAFSPRGFALDLLKQNDLPQSAWFLNAYAFHNLLDALANKNDEELDASIDAANEAIRVAESPGHAGEANCSSVCQFNLGLALLARGRIADARNAYLEGVRALDSRRSQERYCQRSHRLETLAAMRCGPSMRPDDEAAGCARKLGVDEMKALLVGGPASEGLPLAVANENFTLSASASELTASARDVAKEDLWLVWYQLEPSWNSWRAVQRFSGGIEDKPKRDGALAVQRSYLQRYASSAKCLAPGKYRAELYANGVLVASRLTNSTQIRRSGSNSVHPDRRGEVSRSQHAILPAVRIDGRPPRVDRWIDALARDARPQAGGLLLDLLRAATLAPCGRRWRG